MEQKRVNTIGLDEVYTGGRQQDRLALDVEVGGLGGWRVGVGCVGACVGVVRVGGGARGERAGAGRAPGAPATPPRHSHAHTLSLLRWRSLARTSLGGCSHPRKRSARCATGGFGVWLGGGEGEGGLGERLAARARPRALLIGPPHRPPPPPPPRYPPPSPLNAHRFHGIQPSKNTRERRRNKALEEVKAKRQAAGAEAAASVEQMKQVCCFAGCVCVCV